MRIRPSWSPSGHILSPALLPFWCASIYVEATLVQRMLFIALMAVAQVSPNVFCSQGDFLQCTSEHYIIYRLHTHIHLCYMLHGIQLIYITFMHNVYTFFFFTVQVRSGPAQSGPTLSGPAQSSPAQSGPVTIRPLNNRALKQSGP